MSRKEIGLSVPHRSPKEMHAKNWRKLITGVRVDGDKVIISAKGGNDAARELCGALIEEMNK
jgi:hypothetical protein